MEKLTLRQQEKIFKEILINHFKIHGFIYSHEYQNSNFRKINNNNTLEQFTIYGLAGTKQHTFVHEFAFLGIEEIIFEIGLPNVSLNDFDRKKDFLFTVRNNQIMLTYNTEEQPVETEQDCIGYCQSIIAYMETEGKAFIEKYSYLPNVLNEMDYNTSQNVYWSHGIFKGVQAPYFKGLIISKMCNDTLFEEKIKLVDWIYYTKENNLSEFIPYYEKLKERLQSVEPIYNVV